MRTPRARELTWWVVAIAVLIGAPIAWYLGSPLFVSKTVVEEFPSTATSEPVPATPRILSMGTFVDADSFHQGSGTALVTAVDGQALLRLEEFRVTNGPDLYIYLAVHPKPASRANVDEGFVNLGRLKGNIGAQNYPVPAGTDLARFRSAVIYCQRFHVVFATATLQRSQ